MDIAGLDYKYDSLIWVLFVLSSLYCTTGARGAGPVHQQLQRVDVGCNKSLESVI